MVSIFWSPKGGVGVTSVACITATLALRSGPVLVVDMSTGDVSAALGGSAASQGLGLSDWMDSEAGVDAIDSLVTEVGPGIAMLPTKRVAAPAVSEARLADLGAWINSMSIPVFIDGGTEDNWMRLLPHLRSVRTVLVVRNCFLSLQRSLRARPADHVVLVRESHRSIEPTEVAQVLARQIDIELPLDPGIARCIDAGVLNTRLPRQVARSLSPLVSSLARQGRRPGESATADEDDHSQPRLTANRVR